MNIFEKFYEDLFASADFQNSCKINGVKISCIVSQITINEEFTKFGVDEGISFYLRIQAKDCEVQKGDEVEFKNVKYWVDNFSLDGQGLTYKIYLKAQSTK